MTRPLLPIPPEAKRIQRRIIAVLRRLRDEGILSTDRRFSMRYRLALRLYDDYQRAVVAAAGLTVQCHAGCAVCCCHWADDIYSFEAELVARAVRAMSSRRRAAIIESCRASVADFARLQRLSMETLTGDEYREIADTIDMEEIVIAGFYQLKSPCPLLDRRGRCSVYALRPLICRSFINLGEAISCVPDAILDAGESTYILDLDAESNGILDELSARHARYPGDTGLRSLLLQYLEEPC